MTDPDATADVVPDHAYLSDQAGGTVDLLGPDGEPALGLHLAAPADHRVDAGWESWSVDLTGPAEPRLDQGTFRVRFADGGETWLFIVPVAADATSTTYQSTFTREAT